MGEIKKNTIIYSIRQSILLVLSFLVNIYTTKQLTSNDFGILVYYNTVVAALGFLTDGSLWAGFIQSKEELTKEYLNKLFTLSLIVFSSIAIILICITNTFNISFLLKGNVIYYSLITIFATTLQAIIYAKFQKDLQISKIAFCDMISSLVYYILLIVLVCNNLGFRALLISLTVKSILGVFFAFIFYRGVFIFDLKFRNSDFLVSLKKGLVNILSFPVNYTRSLLNPVIVGHYCGLWGMGVVDRSVMIAGIPSNILTIALQKVLFPVFSKSLNENNRDITKQICKTTFYTAFLDKFFYIPLILVIHPAIQYFFGTKWEAMEIPIYILTVGNMLWGSISGVYYTCLFSLGEFKRNFYINVISTALVIPLSIFLCYRWKIVGFCFVSTVLWLSVYYVIYYVNKRLSIKSISYEYLFPFFISVFTIFLCWNLFKYWAFNYILLKIIVEILVCCILYFFIIVCFDRKYIRLFLVGYIKKFGASGYRVGKTKI